MNLKVSSFLPPILLSFVKSFLKNSGPVWAGNYKNWHDAKMECTGYDQNNILDRCANAINLVKNGNARYERDSVIFVEPQYSWALTATLLKTALRYDNRLCVLDFGGSLGSTYFQNKDFLNDISKIDWCIVEQPNFVDRGKKEFETSDLHFFYDIESCLAEFNPQILILSSVLQYLEDPQKWITMFCKFGIETIIIDRTAFINDYRDHITKQTVPPEIYAASYPTWFFNKESFLKNFTSDYIMLAEFESFCDKPLIINNSEHVYWAGFILKKRNE